MNLMSNILSKTGVAALAVGATFALAPVAASAATIYASSVDIITDGSRGTADGRDNTDNALGASDGDFFELGYSAVVEFQFGTPTGQSFFGPGSVVEVTNGNADTWQEAVKIEVGMKGDNSSFVTALPNPFTNNSGSNSFTFNGVFDTVRLTDLTWDLYQNSDSTANAGGGFDVDSIGVNPVPLPAAGWLLVAGLGGLGALRRRKKAA